MSDSTSSAAPLALRRFSARRLAMFPALAPLALGSLMVSLSLGNPVVAQFHFVVLGILTAWMIYIPLRVLLDRRGFGPWNGCDASVAGFAGTIGLSVILSPDRIVSFYAAFPALVLLSYYFLLSEILKSVRAHSRIFCLLAVTAVIVSIIGILQYLGVELLPYTAERRNVKQVVLATLGNPNFVASYIVPVMFVIPAMVFGLREFGRRKWFLIIAILAELLLFTCLIMAGARGGWMAMVGGVSALAMLFVLARGRVSLGFNMVRVPWKFAAGFAAVLCLLVLLLVVPNPLIKSRFDIAQRLTSMKEVRTRFFYWAVAGEMFAREPVFGIGYHRFSSSFWDEVVRMQERNPENLMYREYLLRVPSKVPGQAHNEFIEIAAEQGLVGLAAFMGMLCWFFVKGLSVVLAREFSGKQRARVLYLLCALLAILIDGLFGFPLQLPASALLFWTILSVLRNDIYSLQEQVTQRP